MTNNFPEILTKKKINQSQNDFRNALFGLDQNTINVETFEYLTTIYISAKKLDVRNKILKLLYNFDFPPLRDFFSNAYKKEKYLDMKIYALRGLSNFIEEKEIAKLLKKFNQTLAKRQETAPHNYHEYELLRGKNALPFLVNKFGYACFKETLEQVNKQYYAMPEAFKNHFTTDEHGEIIRLRSETESIEIINTFFNQIK
jgi:hypothetical protein